MVIICLPFFSQKRKMRMPCYMPLVRQAWIGILCSRPSNPQGRLFRRHIQTGIARLLELCLSVTNRLFQTSLSQEGIPSFSTCELFRVLALRTFFPLAHQGL